MKGSLSFWKTYHQAFAKPNCMKQIKELYTAFWLWSLYLCESSHKSTEIQSWEGPQRSSCQLLQFKGEESETQRTRETCLRHRTSYKETGLSFPSCCPVTKGRGHLIYSVVVPTKHLLLSSLHEIPKSGEDALDFFSDTDCDEAPKWPCPKQKTSTCSFATIPGHNTEKNHHPTT